MTAEARSLIFRNLLNGVPAPEIARAFQLSVDEVNKTFAFVVRKVRSYAYDQHMPLPDCETLPAARCNRMLVLFILERLNLDREPRYRRIVEVPAAEVFK